MRKSHRDLCQIITVAQMMARLKGEIVHRAEHPPIRRPSEADWLHDSKLAAHPLLRNVEPLEEAPQRCAQNGCQARAQLARREQHREQAALARRDSEFGAPKTHEMNVPIPESTSRWRGCRELLWQVEPRPHALRATQCQHSTTRPDATE